MLAATVDLRGAIGFSSFGVLTYYAIANAAAWTLPPCEGGRPLVMPAVGLAGCGLLASFLPVPSLLTGCDGARSRRRGLRAHPPPARRTPRAGLRHL